MGVEGDAGGEGGDGEVDKDPGGRGRHGLEGSGVVQLAGVCRVRWQCNYVSSLLEGCLVVAELGGTVILVVWLLEWAVGLFGLPPS